MENYFLIAGILLNTILIIVNRFIKQLPNRVQIPLLLVGIGLMIAGILLMKKA